MNPDRFELLKDIVLRVVDLPEAERQSILDQACGDDRELRAEVEKLLSHDRSPALSHFASRLSPIQHLPLTPSDDGVVGTRPPSDRFAPEQILGNRYRIVRLLGRGGMGEVWRAYDLKLQVDVALKSIRSERFSGEQGLELLRREVRTAREVISPNVCRIFDLVEEEGQEFVSMEYIDGETLQEILSERGPLDLQEVMSIASQFISGLEAIHQAGLVHQDVKPENVMITRTGRVVLMDFGIAKGADEDRRGGITGTPAYMAPEQAIGKAVDSRSDVFSFGTMLYEMATGKRPFEGETVTAILAQIVEKEPQPPSEIRHDLPPELERIVLRCLSKDAENRYHDTRDLAAELQELCPHPVAITSGRRTAFPFRKRHIRLGVSAALVLTLTLAAAWWWSGRRHPVARSEVKVTRLTALRAESGGAGLMSPALSPDGRKLAYIHNGDLDLVLLESGDVRTLPLVNADSTRAEFLAWHPDNERIFVRGGDNTWLLNTVTNQRELIHVDSTATVLAVSPDGKRLALMRHAFREFAILRVGSDSLRVLRRADQGKVFEPCLAWSPNGTQVAYYEFQGVAPANWNCWTSDLSGNPRLVNLQERTRWPGSYANGLCWLPDGRLVISVIFSQEHRGEVWAAKLDPGTGTMSPASMLLSRANAEFDCLTTSTDGKRLTYRQVEVQFRLQMLEMGDEGARPELRRVSVEDWPAENGVWSRDGQRIFFAVRRNEKQEDIYVRNIEANQEEPFLTGPGIKLPECLSPDGLCLLYWQSTGGPKDLMSIPVSGGSAKVFARLAARGVKYVRSAAVPGMLVTGTRRGDEYIIRKLGPDGIPAPDSLRVEVGEPTDPWVSMDISPDGKQIALSDLSNSRGRIRIIDLQSGQVHEIPMPWSGRLQFLSWACDGKSLYVSGLLGMVGDHLLPYWLRQVTLDGESEVLWQSEDTWPSQVRASPDGRHVAFNTREPEFDVWMIEGF